MDQPFLVLTDGSPSDERLLPYASVLARRCRAPVLLLRPLPIDAAPRAAEAAAQARERAWAEAGRQLDRLGRRLADAGAAVETLAEVGEPAATAARLAGEQRAAALVLATRGPADDAHGPLGGVATRLLRLTHRPVLLLAPAVLQAGRPEALLGPVLIPLDGSAASARILPVVLPLARRLGAPLLLVRALEPEGLAGFRARGLAPYGVTLAAAAREAAIAEATADLRAVAVRHRCDDRTAQVLVEIGAPAPVIVAAAARTNAGWIAMATHARGGVAGLLLGRTALDVLGEARTPVLVVPRPEEDQA